MITGRYKFRLKTLKNLGKFLFFEIWRGKLPPARKLTVIEPRIPVWSAYFEAGRLVVGVSGVTVTCPVGVLLKAACFDDNNSSNSKDGAFQCIKGLNMLVLLNLQACVFFR